MSAARDDGRFSGVYTGEWTGTRGRPPSPWTIRIRDGRPISFNRTWHGHRMTDAECGELLAGGTVELPDVPRTDPDDPPVRVALGEYLWHHRIRTGIMAVNRREQTVPIPYAVMGRPLSAAERSELASGGSIRVSGLHNPSTMRDCSATLSTADDGYGHRHIIISAMKSNPAPPRHLNPPLS